MSQARKFLCIHGHFYQPPRENPWLEAVEGQPSAAPFHDWNERVTAECYGPNSAARILDDKGRIRKLLNNYELLSFNFGPTLLSWLERSAPEIYAAVRRADQRSGELRGHGNALAQVHNHIILPLASERDRRTQVRWGIADFRSRFGRAPEGMWLAETAVDTASLEALAAEGIRFTVLAPHQAEALRPLNGDANWTELGGAPIDGGQPYLCRLPSGRDIALFFYDGGLSRAIAFEGALRNGAELLARVRSAYQDSGEDQLLTIGVDGETFGHHSRFGEMAVAWVLDRLLAEGDIEVTNFGAYLESHPPRVEVRLRERSSWSCAHGVERWRADCGCTTGDGGPGWNQQWRAPLREALDGLKARLDEVFEGLDLFRDPWAARDEYLGLLRTDSPQRRTEFLNRHLHGPAKHTARIRFWTALEMQRAGLLMFTSCGWFFDELSRIEGLQILAYAARAIQLAAELNGDLEPEFLSTLARARSNVAEEGDGAAVYTRHVKPLIVGLRRVVAHAAIESLAFGREAPESVYCYDIEVHDVRNERAASSELSVGRVTVQSRTTREEHEVVFCVAHFAGHDFHCAVRGGVEPREYARLRDELFDLFEERSATRLIRAIDEAFGADYFNLRDLFQEERRRVLYRVSDDTLRRTEETYRALYEENRALMAFAERSAVPVLESFRYASSFVLGVDIKRALRAPLDSQFFSRLEDLADDARRWNAEFDGDAAGWHLSRRLEEAMTAVVLEPGSLARLRTVRRLLDLAPRLGVKPDLWQVQNLFYSLCAGLRRRREDSGLAVEPAVTESLRDLALRLGFDESVQALC